MFDQISWICPAWRVGTSVPKSRPTSSYLSPSHFIAASSPARTAPAQYLILRPPFLTRSSALQWRALSGARARPMAEQVPPAPGLAYELALPRHDLAAGEGQHRHPAQLEAVERIVAGPRVELPLVDHAVARRIEENHVRVAAHRDRALLGIEPEDARRIGRERCEIGRAHV